LRPVIGVTCCYDTEANRYYLPRDYVMSIHAGGGIPLILPHYGTNDASVIINKIDGLILSGGGDIDPVLFCEEPRPETGSIDPDRDAFELDLAAKAMEAGKPVLGICRGIQVINVAAGGSVCQDITLAVNHPYKHTQQAPRWHPTHGITVARKSRLFAILGVENLRVNSFHHQMVGRLAPGFMISARSGDGVIEAIEPETKTAFCIGVQFHPENMYKQHDVFLKLFKALIAASSRYISNKNTSTVQENRE